MIWKLATRTMLRTMVGLAALSVTALVGCGSDVSSRPELSMSDAEVPVPEIATNKFALPSGFEAMSRPECVRLTWGKPAMGYTAILRREGLVIAIIDARTFQFDDEIIQAPGTYSYSIAFARGSIVGKQVYQTVTILPAQPRKDSGNNPLEDR